MEFWDNVPGACDESESPTRTPNGSGRYHTQHYYQALTIQEVLWAPVMLSQALQHEHCQHISYSDSNRSMP